MQVYPVEQHPRSTPHSMVNLGRSTPPARCSAVLPPCARSCVAHSVPKESGNNSVELFDVRWTKVDGHVTHVEEWRRRLSLCSTSRPPTSRPTTSSPPAATCQARSPRPARRRLRQPPRRRRCRQLRNPASWRCPRLRLLLLASHRLLQRRSPQRLRLPHRQRSPRLRRRQRRSRLSRHQQHQQPRPARPE